MIRREVPLTQLTDLADQGPWHPQTIEDSLDYAMMVAQQLQEQVDRASLAAVGSGSPLDLTAAVAAAQAAQVAAEAAAATIATFASTAEAQAGTITDKVMSPKRTAEAITAQVTPFSLSGRTYYVEDQKPLGTGSGGSTGGTYHKRDLNTEVIADISGASLASNVVTLPAGTYIIHASAPAFRGDSHKLTLKNDTAVTTVAYGTSAYAARTDGAGLPERGGSASTLTCLLTLAVSSNLSLQHWIETSHSGNGLGYSTGIGGSVKEVFSSFLAFKIS